MAKYRIISVDDDPFYRDLFSSIFEARNIEVTTFAWPSEAWEAIKRDRPDLVTLDVMMPEEADVFDGFGLLAKIRGEAETEKIPVIMISALGDAEDVRHGLDAGADAYLPKHQMTPDSLVELAEKQIGESASR